MSNDAFIIAIQSGVPALATGAPGSSKTRTTEAFAQYCQLEYECLIGSQHDPVDIGGLPRVSADGRSFDYVPPSWRLRLESSKNGGLLHLDELFDCPPAVQAAFLQILGDGVYRTWIAATGNPIDQSTNGFSLSGPVINRLCWLDWETPIESWKIGLLQGWDKVTNTFQILPPTWREHIQLTRTVIVSFLDRCPHLTQAFPSTFQNDPKPFPSLRSWTNTATLLAACQSVDASIEIQDALISGCVGVAACVALRQHIKTNELPSPEDLLRNPQLYKPEKLRGDLALQVLSSVVSAVLRNNTPDRWLAAWEIVDRQCDHAADIAAAVAAPLAKNKPLSTIQLGAASASAPVLSIPAKVQSKLYDVVS